MSFSLNFIFSVMIKFILRTCLFENFKKFKTLLVL